MLNILWRLQFLSYLHDFEVWFPFFKLASFFLFQPVTSESLVTLYVALAHKAHTSGSQCPPLRLLSSQGVWLPEEQLIFEVCGGACISLLTHRRIILWCWHLDYSYDWITDTGWLTGWLTCCRAGCLTVRWVKVFWLVLESTYHTNFYIFNCGWNLSNHIQDHWWIRSHFWFETTSSWKVFWPGKVLSPGFLSHFFFLFLLLHFPNLNSFGINGCSYLLQFLKIPSVDDAVI